MYLGETPCLMNGPQFYTKATEFLKRRNINCEEGVVDIHLLHGRAKHQLLITCQTKGFRHDCLQKERAQIVVSLMSQKPIYSSKFIKLFF